MLMTKTHVLANDKVLTAAHEDYLKAIYTLGRTNPQVSTSLLADHLGFKPASVTGMLKTMADLQLVSYTPYRGVELSPSGERLALEVVRHHRLIELFLVQTLGFSWDEVHEEAERKRLESENENLAKYRSEFFGQISQNLKSTCSRFQGKSFQRSRNQNQTSLMSLYLSLFQSPNRLPILEFCLRHQSPNLLSRAPRSTKDQESTHLQKDTRKKWIPLTRSGFTTKC